MSAPHSGDAGIDPTTVFLSQDLTAPAPPALPGIAKPLPYQVRYVGLVASRLAPAAATGAALLLARMWHSEHGSSPWSLAGSLAIAALLGKLGHSCTRAEGGDQLWAVAGASLYGLAVAAGAFGLMGYSSEPVAYAVALAIVTLWYIIANLHWRADRQDQEQHVREMAKDWQSQAHQRYVADLKRLNVQDDTRVELAKVNLAYTQAEALAEALVRRTERTIPDGRELDVGFLAADGLRQLGQDRPAPTGDTEPGHEMT